MHEETTTRGAQFMTTEELARALIEMAPAMQTAWKQVAGNDAIWQQRADIQYRDVPILGRFRWYRQWRIARLRAQLEE